MIVGYTFQTDLFCPKCLHSRIALNATSTLRALGPATSISFAFRSLNWRHKFLNGDSPFRMDTEELLDRLADLLAIDREDEYTFDSDYFPKTVLHNMVEPHDMCGLCAASLYGDLADWERELLGLPLGGDTA